MNLDLVCLGCLLVGLPFCLMSGLMAAICGGFEANALRTSKIGGSDTGPVTVHITPFLPTLISAFVSVSGGLGILFGGSPLTNPAWVRVPLSLLGSLGVTGTAFAAVCLWLSPGRGAARCIEAIGERRRIGSGSSRSSESTANHHPPAPTPQAGLRALKRLR